MHCHREFNEGRINEWSVGKIKNAGFPGPHESDYGMPLGMRNGSRGWKSEQRIKPMRDYIQNNGWGRMLHVLATKVKLPLIHFSDLNLVCARAPYYNPKFEKSDSLRETHRICRQITVRWFSMSDISCRERRALTGSGIKLKFSKRNNILQVKFIETFSQRYKNVCYNFYTTTGVRDKISGIVISAESYFVTIIR